MNKKLFLSIVFVFLLGMTNTFSQEENSKDEENSSNENSSSNCNKGFRTYSIGGWGAPCNSDDEDKKNEKNKSYNAACYRNANFNNAFPNGLTIGCANYKLILTSAAAVEAFLPSGSAAKVLSENLNNPGKNYKNVLAAQLVALTLSVRFDEYDSDFADNTENLSGLLIAKGAFKNTSVASFLQIANEIIGGCSSAYSLSDVLTTAEAINLSYDNGTVNDSNTDIGDSNYKDSDDDNDDDNDDDDNDNDNEKGYLICNSSNPFAISNTVDKNVSVFDNNDGKATVSVTGGVGPYTFTLTDGKTSGPIASTSFQFTGLRAGNYTATVKDSKNNTITINFTVTQPDPLIASKEEGTIACFGGTTSITITASGGTAPYTNDGVHTVSAGEYSFDVTDANGCKVTVAGTISEPTELQASKEEGTISCFGGTTSVTITASGGTAPYTNDGVHTVSAGEYSFDVTDANGCKVTVAGTISEPTELQAQFEQKNVLCNGESNGTATVTAEGGTGNYSYSWNTTPVQTSATASGLSAGIYEVTITDANNCIKTAAVTITQPDVLSVSISKTDLICSYDLGTATANVTGGTAPYAYIWKSIVKNHDDDEDHDDDDRDHDKNKKHDKNKDHDDDDDRDHDEDEDHETTSNQTTQTANFKTGSWSVMVTDANGCTATNNVDIILLSYTTVTPAGYTGKSDENRWSRNYLVANFDSKFPTGLTIGSGAKSIKFTSAAAIQAFLPSGGAAKSLTGILTNPTAKTCNNALAGQTVALSLTLAFDSDPNFSSSIASLGNRVIRSGAFAGKTVTELLTLANTVLGGGVSSFKPAQISEALEAINKSYDNNNENHDKEEDSNSNYLISTCIKSRKDNSGDSNTNGGSSSCSSEKLFNVYPNQVNQKSNLDFNLNYDTTIKIELYTKNGQYISKIYDNIAKAGKGYSVNINTASLSPDTYLMKIYTTKEVINKRIVISK